MSAEAHADRVHRLGNLVLLDQKKNNSLSKADFAIKRERYQKAFDAHPYTHSVFMRHGQWGLDELKAQHSYAVGQLVDCYSRNSLDGLCAMRSAFAPVVVPPEPIHDSATPALL